MSTWKQLGRQHDPYIRDDGWKRREDRQAVAASVLPGDPRRDSDRAVRQGEGLDSSLRNFHDSTPLGTRSYAEENLDQPSGSRWNQGGRPFQSRKFLDTEDRYSNSRSGSDYNRSYRDAVREDRNRDSFPQTKSTSRQAYKSVSSRAHQPTSHRVRADRRSPERSSTSPEPLHRDAKRKRRSVSRHSSSSIEPVSGKSYPRRHIRQPLGEPDKHDSYGGSAYKEIRRSTSPRPNEATQSYTSNSHKRSAYADDDREIDKRRRLSRSPSPLAPATAAVGWDRWRRQRLSNTKNPDTNINEDTGKTGNTTRPDDHSSVVRNAYENRSHTSTRVYSGSSREIGRKGSGRAFQDRRDEPDREPRSYQRSPSRSPRRSQADRPSYRTERVKRSPSPVRDIRRRNASVSSFSSDESSEPQAQRPSAYVSSRARRNTRSTSVSTRRAVERLSSREHSPRIDSGGAPVRNRSRTLIPTSPARNRSPKGVRWATQRDDTSPASPQRPIAIPPRTGRTPTGPRNANYEGNHSGVHHRFLTRASPTPTPAFADLPEVSARALAGSRAFVSIALPKKQSIVSQAARSPELKSKPQGLKADMLANNSELMGVRRQLTAEQERYSQLQHQAHPYMRTIISLLQRKDPNLVWNVEDFLRDSFRREPNDHELHAIGMMHSQLKIIRLLEEREQALLNLTSTADEAGPPSTTAIASPFRSPNGGNQRIVDRESARRHEPQGSHPSSTVPSERDLRSLDIISSQHVQPEDLSVGSSNKPSPKNFSLPQQAPLVKGKPYEKIVQVGEGTYGKVYKARNQEGCGIVALKRIRMEGEKDGFPVTAMREIKLLQGLNHENVIKLHEMMVSNGKQPWLSNWWM
jgi:hypothetical protein